MSVVLFQIEGDTLCATTGLPCATAGLPCATAGLPSSAAITIGQANRGTRQPGDFPEQAGDCPDFRAAKMGLSPFLCPTLPVVLALALSLTAAAAAEDTVYISSTSSSRGSTRLSGQIVDYTGRQLVLQTAGGQARSYPAENVVKVETPYTREQVEADARMDRGEFDSALALYGKARSAEPRTWVRRQITARMVWCYQALERPAEACGEFLVLVESDPETLYFDCIPLAWMPSQPPPALESTARAWLARDDLPAAVLLGASHLMNTPSRSEAIERLARLAVAGDGRIAPLAVAQTWRAAVATTDPERLRTWQQAIERMPEPLRAGPYYVLGRALAQQGQWEESALALMRVPILYGEHRALAARSLLDAGRSLEKLGRTTQAARLYRELIEGRPGTRSADEARLRLDEMRGEGRGSLQGGETVE